MRNVLVTGAAGFIGAHVVRELLKDHDCRVIAIDDLSGGATENLPDHENLTFVKASIVDHVRMQQLFDEYAFENVYHLAAYAAEGLSHFIRRFNYTNNVVGSINLINEAVRTNVKTFVFTSSIAVYGALDPPMKETDDPKPEDPYGIAKRAVELDLMAAQEMFGMDYVIFRPHNVYGEYQNLGDPYRNVIGIFMNKIMQGDPMTVFGDGTQTRAFSYVGDIAPAIAQSPSIAAAKNEIFNIGADVPYSVNDLASHVAEAMGASDHGVTHLPARNEVMNAYADHNKAKRVFANADKPTSLEEGLARMADWARSAGIRTSQIFTEVEVTRNMPPSWQRMLQPG